MTAQIRANVEIDLHIIEKGIATRFLEWWESAPSLIDESYKRHIVDDRGDQVPWYLNNVDVYTYGMYLFGVYKVKPLNGDQDDYLLVHLYPNQPVQDFYKFLPEFLNKLGIHKYEGDESYISEVKKTLDVLY